MKLPLPVRHLLISQFCGGVNDNLLKTTIFLFLIKDIVVKADGEGYLSLANGLFFAPFILFSSYAGNLLDRYSKTQIILYVKLIEVLIAVLGFYFLIYTNQLILFALIFFKGVAGVFFGPAKYGVLLDFVAEEDLSSVTGYVEFFMLFSLIVGMILAGILSDLGQGSYFYSGIVMFLVSIIGYIYSVKIPYVEPVGVIRKIEINFVKGYWQTLMETKNYGLLFYVILAVGFFWLFGTLFQVNLMLYTKQVLGYQDSGTSGLLAVMAIGVGVGCFISGLSSRDRVNLKFVLYGMFCVTVASMLLPFVGNSNFLNIVLVAVAGLSAGFYYVPLQTYLQLQSPVESRGRFIATCGAVAFIMMIVASGLFWVLKDLCGMTTQMVFVFAGILSLLALVYFKKQLSL